MEKEIVEKIVKDLNLKNKEKVIMNLLIINKLDGYKLDESAKMIKKFYLSKTCPQK